MRTEIAQALIGGIAAVVAASVPVVFSRLRKARTQIESLKFVVSHMLTRPQREHLRKIASREAFFVNVDDNWGRFRDEISHLLNSEFITFHPDREGLDLFRPGEPKTRRVDDHCESTKAGRAYLDLWGSVQRRAADGD